MLQNQYSAAISHLERVLEISNEMGDHVGDADAYGTIADIYTDMGDFDAAAKCESGRMLSGMQACLLPGMLLIDPRLSRDLCLQSVCAHISAQMLAEHHDNACVIPACRYYDRYIELMSNDGTVF